MTNSCLCGCGSAVSAGATYVRGHHFRRDPTLRFLEKIRPLPSGCWLWLGALDDDGYGNFWDGSRVVRAHRWAYERWREPIAVGLEIDHGCRSRSCVNPAHMEPVTHRENVRRGEAPPARQARQTYCKNGHELVGDNLEVDRRGHRRCRTCHVESSRRYRAATK
jgi:hypothetical protein